MFFDIHSHCIPETSGVHPWATPSETLRHYDAVSIDKGVIVAGKLADMDSFHCQDAEEILKIAATHSDRLIPFCSFDPRLTDLSERMERAIASGAKGFGELTFNLKFEDPRSLKFFETASKLGVPVTFHLSTDIGYDYGLVAGEGLTQLEAVLKRFPDLILLGHSQTFWAEIGPDPSLEDSRGYPKGPVRSGLRIVDLLRKYPNLYGDLSAGSGFNAISRDLEFGIAFLTEFQDKLCFGTDMFYSADCPKEACAPLSLHLLKLRDTCRISESAFQKIAFGNATRLLHIE